MRTIFLLITTAFFLFAQTSWDRANLLNNQTLSYFFPFELWLGKEWDGSKEKNFHEVDTMLQTSQKLQGPFEWYHPYLKKSLQVYKLTSNNNVELFTFYPSGVIKLYDKKHDAYLNNGISFPLGYGWKVGKLYRFSQEVWIKEKHYMRELGIKISDITFEKEQLKSITYDYFIDKEHKATYTYEVNKGLVKTVIPTTN